MLPYPNRLPKTEILEVLRSGRRFTHDTLHLLYKRTDGTPRFAIIVSTKIDKRTTSRNRIRRVLSESVRQLLPYIEPIDAVLRVRRDISGLTQIQSYTIVKEILKGSGLLK